MTMNEQLPPKMVKAQLVRLDDNLKQIERRQVAGIQRAPGSLPVLEAFQAFLENEQRKARRRMLAVTAFAALLLCAVAGGGFVLVQQQLRRAAVDVAAVGTRTDAIAATIENLKRDQDAELLELENRFRDESSQIIAQYSSLQQAQQALAEKFNSDSLETLEARLLRLEAENETLQSRLASLTSGPIVTAPAEQVSPSAPQDERLPDAVDTPPGPVTTAEVSTAAVMASVKQTSPAVTVVEHSQGYLMTIVPEGHSSGIRWMLPRPLTQE
jgi:hypothetical protein